MSRPSAITTHHEKRAIHFRAWPVAAIAVLLSAAVSGGCSAHHSRGSKLSSPNTTASNGCPRAGCATVDTVLHIPNPTVFHGASCKGTTGTWYLNVTVGGPNNEPLPSYSLRWTFAPGSSSAKPTGRISISSPNSQSISMALTDGTLRLTGTAPGGHQVSANGQLVVSFSQASAGTQLMITETGLSTAQAALGLPSPFSVHDQPATVPIRTAHSVPGC